MTLSRLAGIWFTKYPRAYRSQLAKKTARTWPGCELRAAEARTSAAARTSRIRAGARKVLMTCLLQGDDCGEPTQAQFRSVVNTSVASDKTNSAAIAQPCGRRSDHFGDYSCEREVPRT